MTMDDYKRWIMILIKNSNDMEYIIAVYSFAMAYPDKSKKKED